MNFEACQRKRLPTPHHSVSHDGFVARDGLIPGGSANKTAFNFSTLHMCAPGSWHVPHQIRRLMADQIFKAIDAALPVQGSALVDKFKGDVQFVSYRARGRHQLDTLKKGIGQVAHTTTSGSCVPC